MPEPGASERRRDGHSLSAMETRVGNGGVLYSLVASMGPLPFGVTSNSKLCGSSKLELTHLRTVSSSA